MSFRTVLTPNSYDPFTVIRVAYAEQLGFGEGQYNSS